MDLVYRFWYKAALGKTISDRLGIAILAYTILLELFSQMLPKKLYIYRSLPTQVTLITCYNPSLSVVVFLCLIPNYTIDKNH